MEQIDVESYPVVLTAVEISQILRVSKPTAYEIMRGKDFPLIKIGRSRRVFRDSFFQWLTEKELNINEKI